jgi:hypothetical protein
LRVLLPDINESRKEYWGNDKSLRVGLMQLKGLHEAALAAILEERRKKPFVSLSDFLCRVEIDVADVKILIKSGAFDSVSGGATRPELIWQALAWNERARSAAEIARAADARVWRARSFLLPTITLTGDYTRRGSDGEDLLLSGREARVGRVSVTQTIFDAQAWPLLRQAQRAREASHADAAGAIADADTARRARHQHLDPQIHLDTNNSNPIFAKLGDLVVTGPTGTNVADVAIGWARKAPTPG